MDPKFVENCRMSSGDMTSIAVGNSFSFSSAFRRNSSLFIGFAILTAIPLPFSSSVEHQGWHQQMAFITLFVTNTPSTHPVSFKQPGDHIFPCVFSPAKAGHFLKDVSGRHIQQSQ